MPFVTPTEVDAIKEQVSLGLNALAQAFVVCQTAGKVPASDVADFERLKSACNAFTSEPSGLLNSAAQVDAGQALLRQQAPWYAKIKGYGCDAPATPPDPVASAPKTSLDKVVDALPLLLLVLLAAQVAPAFKRRA